MKKIILIIFLFLPAFLSAQETVKIGTFTLPPFMMETGPDKKTGGVAIDFWKKHIAPEMNVTVEAIGPFPAMRIIKMLEDGTIDLIPNMTKIKEREAKFIFPKTPLSRITTCLVVRKDSPLKIIRKKEELFNLRIGFLEGGFIPPLIRHEKIKIELVYGADYFQRFIGMLDARRTDAFLHINHLSLMYELKLMGISEKYRIILLPVKKINVYCLFQKTEKGRILAEKFEKINAPLFKAGVYNQMAESLLKK
ncbi:MAG: transporter substrate-binding domain-containing protein [Spirochaetes bacterium]|nr:transporter substrate-binding domain-containing protein [Spirochaetota bacterium]